MTTDRMIIVGTRKNQDDLYNNLLPEITETSQRRQREYLNRLRENAIPLYPPKLEGFEQGLGRKFTCEDCVLTEMMGKTCNLNRDISVFPHCFRLSDETKAAIKLKDREIEDTKIDTHPRYLIREEMMYYIPEEPVSSFMDFHPNKSIPIRQALIKLELIL